MVLFPAEPSHQPLYVTQHRRVYFFFFAVSLLRHQRSPVAQQRLCDLGDVSYHPCFYRKVCQRVLEQGALPILFPGMEREAQCLLSS